MLMEWFSWKGTDVEKKDNCILKQRGWNPGMNKSDEVFSNNGAKAVI